MTTKNYFYLNFKYVSNHKKTFLIQVLLFLICFFVFFISFSIYQFIDQYVNDMMNKNLLYRTLYVNIDVPSLKKEKMLELEKMQHVILVTDTYDAYGTVPIWKNEKMDGYIHLVNGSKDVYPSIKYGRKLDSNKTGEMVCSESILPDSMGMESKDLYLSDYQNIKKLLNQTISIEYQALDYSKGQPVLFRLYQSDFKIVGLYSKEYNLFDTNTCYVNDEDIHVIDQRITNNYYDYYPESSTIYVIVDKAENLDITMTELLSMGYQTDLSVHFDNGIIYGVRYLSVFIAGIILIFTIIMMYLYIGRFLKKKETEIGILKALGYREDQISKLMTIQVFTLLFVAVMLSILLYTILYLLLMVISQFTPLAFSQYMAPFSWIGLIISFALIIVLLGISYIKVNRHVHKTSVRNLL